MCIGSLMIALTPGYDVIGMGRDFALVYLGMPETRGRATTSATT